MPCSWVYLASRNSPERFCDKPGHLFCEEHQREIDAMEKSDTYWEEILASLQAVCDEPEQPESPLCAACGSRPVHEGSVYCDQCRTDDPLGLLEPQG